jgi:predicted permease
VFRRLRHAPGFALTSIGLLAVGVAAVVAIFTLYRRVVLDPVAVPEPDRLVSFYTVNPTIGFVPPTLSYPRYQAIRASASLFTNMGGYSTESVALTGDGTPEQVRAMRVTEGFFETIRLQALHGRLFAPAEDLPNGPAVCVIAHDFWVARFGRAPVVGRTIVLDGRATEIVGVLPADLPPPWAGRQIFLPRVFEDSLLTPQSVANGASYLDVVARLAPGVTIDRAAAEMRAIDLDYRARQAGRGDATNDTAVRPLRDTVAGRRGPVLVTLLAAVAAVLLITCANVSALFLSRLVARRREMAVRQALGATRARIVREVVGESLSLAVPAGVIAIALAEGLLAIVRSSMAPQLPAGIVLHVDPWSAAVTVGAALLSALAVGLLPAIHVTRGAAAREVASFDRGASAGLVARRSRAALVVAETALSVVLLVGASLLLASLVTLQRTSPGFDAAGVSAAFANLPAGRYGTPERQAAFFTSAVEELRASPDVTAAAAVFGLPFHDENFSHPYAIAGLPVPSTAERPRAGLRVVTADYFAVMGIRLLEGRLFTSGDRAGSPMVCVVNASLARRQFPGESAVGRVLIRGRTNTPVEIVGVIADVRTNGLRNQTPDEVFYPFGQLPRSSAALVVRTRRDPAVLLPVMQSAVARIDPDLPLSRFGPMRDRLASTFALDRAMALATTAFAALAVGLAALGLYAVLAHAVSSRRREIGVRLAMGAARVSIARLVFAQSLRLVGLGVAIGLALSWAAAGLLASQLFEVEPRTPWVYGVTATLFLIVGVAASLAPALRASNVDPVVALRG